MARVLLSWIATRLGWQQHTLPSGKRIGWTVHRRLVVTTQARGCQPWAYSVPPHGEYRAARWESSALFLALVQPRNWPQKETPKC